MIVKCPNCLHDFDVNKLSTLRSMQAVNVPVLEHVPLCMCGHVKLLHNEQGKCNVLSGGQPCWCDKYVGETDE